MERRDSQKDAVPRHRHIYGNATVSIYSVFIIVPSILVFVFCLPANPDEETDVTFQDMMDWNVTLMPEDLSKEDVILDMDTNKAINNAPDTNPTERVEFAVKNEVIIGKLVHYKTHKVKQKRDKSKSGKNKKPRDLSLFPFTSLFNYSNPTNSSYSSSVKCDETYIGEEGMLVSPNFKPNRTHGNECTWRIGIPNLGAHITLTFPIFKLKSGYDCKDEYIEVWNGENQELLGCFCGNMLPRRLTSPSDKMIVRFVSNAIEQKLEFIARFFKSSCGEIIEMEEGMIESPNFVFVDSPSRECNWEITVPPGHQVALKFHSMTADPGYDCTVEYLEIWDTLRSTRLSCICGDTPHDQITTMSNKMSLRFVSRGPKQRMRFSAAFWSEGKPRNVMEVYRPQQAAPPPQYDTFFAPFEDEEDDDMDEEVDEPEYQRA